MTETQSKSRQQAEISFGQTQFFARGHAVEELTSIIDAREAKTQRLREARLAKEQNDRDMARTPLKPTRTRKT